MRGYDDLGGSDEVNGDGDGTLMPLVIGMRGDLKCSTAKGTITIAICGYDTDPREIWDIPEAREHVRYWAGYPGLTHSADVLASPLEANAADTPLAGTNLGFPAKCGALQDIHPDMVGVTHRGI